MDPNQVLADWMGRFSLPPHVNIQDEVLKRGADALVEKANNWCLSGSELRVYRFLFYLYTGEKQDHQCPKELPRFGVRDLCAFGQKELEIALDIILECKIKQP